MICASRWSRSPQPMATWPGRARCRPRATATRPATDMQPVYQNGAVYVGYYYDHPVDAQNTVRHGVIEALDAATGRLRWRRELGTELNGAPVVDGATVYISASVLHTENQQAPTESGLVAALDTQTGAVRWQRALDAPPGMVASAAGRVYLIMSEQFAAHALALNANDGSIAWDYTSDAPLTRGGDAENSASSAPLVVGGRVFVEATERAADGSGQLKLVALDADNGHVAWQRQTQGIAATPAVNQGGDTICLSDYVSEQDTSDILGLAVADGAQRWSVTAMPGIVSGCAASGESFYLTQRASDMKSGTVFALNSQDGKQLWKTATAAPVAADGILAPTVVNGAVGVYLVDDEATSGPVTSAMAVLQRERWQAAVETCLRWPPRSDNGYRGRSDLQRRTRHRPAQHRRLCARDRRPALELHAGKAVGLGATFVAIS